MYLIPPPKGHGVDRRSTGHLRPEICAFAAGGWARRLPFVVSGGLIRRCQAQSVRNCSVRGAFSEAGSGIWGARLSYLAFRPSPAERPLAALGAASVRPCFSALAHSGTRYARCFGASSRDNEARKVRPSGARQAPSAGRSRLGFRSSIGDRAAVYDAGRYYIQPVCETPSQRLGGGLPSRDNSLHDGKNSCRPLLPDRTLSPAVRLLVRRPSWHCSYARTSITFF